MDSSNQDYMIWAYIDFWEMKKDARRVADRLDELGILKKWKKNKVSFNSDFINVSFLDNLVLLSSSNGTFWVAEGEEVNEERKLVVKDPDHFNLNNWKGGKVEKKNVNIPGK